MVNEVNKLVMLIEQFGVLDQSVLVKGVVVVLGQMDVVFPATKFASVRLTGPVSDGASWAWVIFARLHLNCFISKY